MSRSFTFAAVLGAGTVAHAEVVLVLGEGDEVAAELDGRGHDARSPAEVEQALRAQDRQGAPPSGIAETLAREGREAYVNLDFALATTKLSRAIESALAAGRGEIPPGLAALHLDLGIARLAAGERPEAEREIALALRIDPELRADRAVHGPPVVRTVERIRRAQPRARRTTIVTDPAGAQVTVDGRPRGEGPATIEDLAEGSHYVSARLSGRTPVTLRIEVGGDAAASIPVALVPAPAARRALDAIESSDLDAAASIARPALDADAAIVVRRDGASLGAVVVRRVAPVRTASGADADALADALYPPAPDLHGPVAAPTTAAPVEPSQPSEDGGGGWWLLAGGVVLAGAGIVAAILLTSNDEAPDDTVVPVVR